MTLTATPPAHPATAWAHSFQATDDDVEFLLTLLLERETPMTTEALARALVAERLQQQVEAAQARFRDTQPYNPSAHVEVGQRLVFPALQHATGTVVAQRDGDNPDYGTYTVIDVLLDDGDTRAFATNLTTPHRLAQQAALGASPLLLDLPSIDEVFAAAGDHVLAEVARGLETADDLLNVAGLWFPQSLMLEANVGHLNMAEALLDMLGGQPQPTREILEQMGGLGSGPLALQEFSLNVALNSDARFDEVGPAGEVLWTLRRMQPADVLDVPVLLRPSSVPYDADALTAEMLALAREIGDEHSPLDVPDAAANGSVAAANITLIYPHRRQGTLPLNTRVERVFPTARRTPRVSVTLVDGHDGDTYKGWVVRADRYVAGLGAFYAKHQLPVGAYVRLRPSDKPGHVVVSYDAYRPRSEYVLLVDSDNGELAFQNIKRPIGAAFDEFMLLGVDNLAAMDRLFEPGGQRQRPLAVVLRQLVDALSRFTNMGQVHAKTLYSVLNVLRRTAPEPMLATLATHPDFDNVGGHYWRLS